MFWYPKTCIVIGIDMIALLQLKLVFISWSMVLTKCRCTQYLAHILQEKIPIFSHHPLSNQIYPAEQRFQESYLRGLHIHPKILVR